MELIFHPTVAASHRVYIYCTPRNSLDDYEFNRVAAIIERPRARIFHITGEPANDRRF